MFNEALKSISVSDLQTAIARAVSEIAGKQFECRISSINLEQLASAKLEIVLSEKNPLFDSSAS